MKTKMFLLISFFLVLSTLKHASGQEKDELTWYTSTPIHASKIFAKEFEKRKGLKLKVVNFEIIDEEVLENILVGRKPVPDVLDSSRVDILRKFLEINFLLKYRSPENVYYPRKRVTNEDYLGYLTTTPILIAYNKEAVPKADAPVSWYDFLKPRWEGEIATFDFKGDRMTNRALELFWEKRLGRKFLYRLEKLRPISYKDSGSVSNALIIRETLIGAVSFDQFSEHAMQRDYPIRYVWPKEGIIIVPKYIAIPYSAKNQRAAKLFMDFILSGEGQLLYQKLLGTTMSLREGVELLEPFQQKLSRGYPIFLFRVADDREFLVPYWSLK